MRRIIYLIHLKFDNYISKTFFYIIFLVIKIRAKINENLDIVKSTLKTEPNTWVLECHVSAISYFSFRNGSILRKFIENYKSFSEIMAILTDIWKLPYFFILLKNLLHLYINIYHVIQKHNCITFAWKERGVIIVSWKNIFD